MSHNEDILRVQGLEVFYGDEPVLCGLDLVVGAGEIVGVVGESGAGKSTLLRAIAGLLPEAARVQADVLELAGCDVARTSKRVLRELRGSTVSFLFQSAEASFDPLFTIGAQFDETMRAHARRDGARQRQIAALECVGLSDPERTLASLPSQLSGGMGQRVALAFALASSPQLLLADEPTSALDGETQGRILELLRTLNEEQGLGILMVSHDIDLVASLADRIVVMRAGQIVEQGVSAQVMNDPQHPYTRELIAAIPRVDGPVAVIPLGETGPQPNDVSPGETSQLVQPIASEDDHAS